MDDLQLGLHPQGNANTSNDDVFTFLNMVLKNALILLFRRATLHLGVILGFPSVITSVDPYSSLCFQATVNMAWPFLLLWREVGQSAILSAFMGGH